ncbi:MAG: flagellar assembly protein FliW [Firmicutes bacterium]|nr:flagellar assembly protein FliW [Bacillota bacterium]
MKIKTKFYEEIEISEEEMIHFPEGLPGFETEKRFVYLHPEDTVFGCLQSCQTPEVAFIVISPFRLCPDYDLVLDEEKVALLGLAKPEDALILAIVTIPPGQPDQATVNLQAPLVINLPAKKGLQVILSDSGYPLRFQLWAKKPLSTASAAK